DRYRTGNVGAPVPGTECRLVDLTTRRPVDVWSTGEVQVRGPQLMAGYLGEETCARIDADGWFSAGDVGYGGDAAALRPAARGAERLAHFERIRLTEALDAVPRTPTGKPQRRLVRTRLRARAAVGPFARTPSRTRKEQTMVTFVNKLTVHGDIDTFLAVKG